MKSFDMKALASRVRKPPKPHIGKRPMKFWLTASDLHLNLHQSHGDLTLVWKRGAKVVSTHPVKVMEKLSPVDESLSVTAAFPGQDLSLLCTIFLGALRARGSVCNAVLSAIALRRAVFSAERATGNHVPPCPLGP